MLATRYKELDLDFGVDQTSLELLVGIEHGTGGKMVAAMDAGTKTCVRPARRGRVVSRRPTTPTPTTLAAQCPLPGPALQPVACARSATVLPGQFDAPLFMLALAGVRASEPPVLTTHTHTTTPALASPSLFLPTHARSVNALDLVSGLVVCVPGDVDAKLHREWSAPGCAGLALARAAVG